MTHDNGAYVKSDGVYVIQSPQDSGGQIIGVYSSERLASEMQRAMTQLHGWAGALTYHPIFWDEP